MHEVRGEFMQLKADSDPTMISAASASTRVNLHVTKHTIEFHIKNATYKLQAVNKTAAVVKALVLGLLG